MASQKVLEHYLAQLRRIEEHREKWCEENVRRHYRDLDKDLKEFLGVQYAELAENDQLTYEILHQKGQYARFIEEVEQRINKFTPQASQDIKNTVQLTYKKCFEGMVDAVEKSKDYEQLKVNLEGVRAVTPDVVRNVVKNSFLEDALEKNHKTVIYDIKQQIGIGLTQGDRMSTMAKRISEQIDSDYKKSVRIARTECHRVREAGFQDSSQRISEKLQENGSDYVMTKTWKTMQDMSVRPYRRKGKKGHKSFVMGSGLNHVKMQGVTVLVDEPFDLGDGYTAMTPGQSGIAGHDINCRCYVSRDLMTKAEFEKLTGRKLTTVKSKEANVAQYEQQEQALLDEKANLEQEKEKYIKRQQNLESYEYDALWLDNVTPADYELKKDDISARRNYFNKTLEHLRVSGNMTGGGPPFPIEQQEKLKSTFEKHLKQLDDFEAQGKAYLKLSKQIKTIDDRLLTIDDDIKTVRAQIMKVKGIDVKKIESEIDVLKPADIKKLKTEINNLKVEIKDLDEEIDKLKMSGDYSSLYDYKMSGWRGEDYIIDFPGVRELWDEEWAELKAKKASGEKMFKFEVVEYNEHKEFFDKFNAIKNSNVGINANAIAELQKKRDILIKKRLNALNKLKATYAPRTTSARILDDLQTFADNNANKFNKSFADIVKSAGIDESKFKEELSKALGEIINDCDVGIRIKTTNLKKVLDETDGGGGFKNLFETKKSGGCKDLLRRNYCEKEAFGHKGDVPKGIDAGNRAIYGMMMPNSRTEKAIDYYRKGPGDWYSDGVTCIIKKDKIFNNASFTVGDSLDYSNMVCGSTFDNPQFNGGYSGFERYAKQLIDSKKDSNEKLMRTFTYDDKYLEVQIYGKENHGIDIIDKVIFNDKKVFNSAKRKGIIKMLDEKKIKYEVLK